MVLVADFHSTIYKFEDTGSVTDMVNSVQQRNICTVENITSIIESMTNTSYFAVSMIISEIISIL